MFLLVVAYLFPIAGLLFMLFLLIKGDIRQRPDVRTFCWFLSSLVLWLGLLWLTDQINNADKSLIFLRAALFVGSFVPLMFFIFSEKFIHSYNKLITFLVGLLSLFFAVISFTNLMISKIESGHTGIRITQSTVLYSLQSVYTILIFIISIIWMRVHRSRVSGKQINKQIRLMAYGAISSVIVGIIGGVVISQSDGSNLLSPLAVTLFATGAFFAIFKLGLFEIRLIVARSLAYILSLSTLIGIFTLVTILISNIIFRNNLNDLQNRGLYTLLAVSLALVFPTIKRFFDRNSNKYFFRDSYDVKSSIDGFSGVLVASIDLDLILKETLQLFNNTVRPQSCDFLIFSKNKAINLQHENSINFDELSSKAFDKYISRRSEEVFVTDNLTSKDEEFKKFLNDQNIGVLVKLETLTGIVGIIGLGPKLSGSIYNTQDIEFLAIIGKELAIALQNALRFKEIQAFNLTLQQKVDDATSQLRRTNQKLKELDEAKDEFISMASHQLRTPLTSMKGYVSMVIEGDAGKISALQRKLLDQAFVSSQRMVYLIADLLNVSRLKTGKFIIESKPTNLADIVEGEISQLIETAKGRNLVLSYDKPKDFPSLMLDETKVRQVVMNFTDNAIYYTPAGGHIKVIVEDKPESIECRIEDDGLGVPKEEQHHLFTKFYRAGNARKARPDGTGLGLFMAKKVIAAQGGAIIFKSQEGKGSVFGFSFSKDKLSPPVIDVDHS